MGLRPSVIDISIGNLTQSEPKHSGPTGRVIRAENIEIVSYKEGSVSTGPQQNTLRQRPGFLSFSNELRSVVDGSIVADFVHEPRLLSAVGDQLVSIDHGRPQVLAEDSWIRHDKIVLTQQLSERVIHTTNRVVEAPDSAWIGDVECVVWCETDIVADVPFVYIGFRDANGAWIIQPKVMYVGASSIHVIARVVTDGSYFWAFVPHDSPDNFQAHVFDATGVELANAGVARNWTTTPGYFDVTHCPSTDVFGNSYSILLVQPAAYTGVGANVTVKSTAFAFDGVATITQNSTNLATAHCSGPVSFLTNNTGNGKAYMATVGEVSGGSANAHVYEITGQAVTHAYDAFPVFADRVDGMTGYPVVNGANVDVVLAVSLLTHGPIADGPIYDPALRAVVSYYVTSGNVSTFIAQHDGVILQSRAFQVDGDWFAVTYYQSGPGTSRGVGNITVSWTGGDYMVGGPDQPIKVIGGDSLTGDAHLVNSTATKLVVSQATGSITHNAGDGVVAATATWTLLNATFVDDPYAVSAVDSFLVVTGATPSSLNTSWRVLSRPSATTVITSPIGANGTGIVNSTLSGATCHLAATTAIDIPVNYGSNGVAIDPSVAGFFVGGTATVAGAAGAGNNATYNIIAIDQNASLPGYSGSPAWNNVTKILASNAPGVREESIPVSATVTVAPQLVDRFLFNNGGFSSLDVGADLNVSGTGIPGAEGVLPITSVFGSVSAFTAGQTYLRPYIFSGSEVVSVTPAQRPYTFLLQSVTFNSSYIGSLIIVNNAANPQNNGAYTIRVIVSAHVVVATPANGVTGQRNEFFANTISVKLDKADAAGNSLQPCWFISPLGKDQQTAGRFDYGIAYADWRFDGDTVPNYFFLGLSSVSVRPDVGLSVTLPYRAQSFTADQTVTINGANIALLNVLQTTVGLKDFTLSTKCGQAINSGQTMLIPGPRASQFSLSGFGEQSVNLGFEQPFFVSQTSDPAIVGLLPNVPYQVVFVAECTDDNGDHVYSIPSLPLDFTLGSGNNVAVYGGRLIGPTDRLVAISIYRTATQGGIPTTQHYRITNPADVNGTGFNITQEGYTYGSANDTFKYTDKIADTTAVVGEVLYTDKGYLPRYPMPAFTQAASWRNRIFAIGYDGAIWMSGEKTDGDSVWFHPALRFVLPTASVPVAVAAMDNYLMVLCNEGQQSYWYIPEATFPDGAGQNGQLPNPVEVQFQGSCSGFAMGTKNGVVYSNTAGGLWLITRNLTNGWLSQPVQDDLTADSAITGLSIDNNQRMYVSDAAGNLFVWDQISGTWWTWKLPSPALLLSTYLGKPVYQDAAYVMAQQAGKFDQRGITVTGCPPLIEFADFDFGGLRSFKCLWAMQLDGEYRGPHNVNITLSYPDETGQEPTEFFWTPDPNEEYIYEFNPGVEESSLYHLLIRIDFDGVSVPGDSMELEFLAAEVGLEQGMNRVPSSNQKPSK